MLADTSFPYEFSVPLEKEDKLLKIRIASELDSGVLFEEEFALKLLDP